MQNKLNILIIFLMITASGLAQEKDSADSWRTNFKDKLYLMGGLGLSFGNETYINIAPVLGYRFTEKLHGGGGIGYSYYNNLRGNFSTNIYQGSVFGRYFILDNIFAHAEYEELYFKWSDGDSYSLTNVYIGGGFNQHLGGKAFAGVLVLYNLNSSPYSPYPNPIVRAGIGFGF